MNSSEPSCTHFSAYAGSTALVTGGAGSIGRNLSNALARAGAEVLVLDDLSSSAAWNVPRCEGVRFEQGSILDEGALTRAFRARPAFVFHLAALFANQNSIERAETDLLVNGLGTLRVLELARRTGVRRVVFCSSGCAVYGSNPPLPVTEDCVSLEADTPYQATKTLGELYCNFFSGHHVLSTVRARLFNSFGPGEIPGRYRNVIPNFMYWSLRGQPLPITGTGEETRSFTFVDDIVDGLLRAGVVPEASGEAFNLASGREVRILDLAEQINALTGSTAGVTLVGRRAWDTHARRLPSVEKARRILGLEARTGLAEGLAETLRWFRANWDRIQATARFPGSEP